MPLVNTLLSFAAINDSAMLSQRTGPFQITRFPPFKMKMEFIYKGMI
jgi:hypothetical protein